VLLRLHLTYKGLKIEAACFGQVCRQDFGLCLLAHQCPRGFPVFKIFVKYNAVPVETDGPGFIVHFDEAMQILDTGLIGSGSLWFTSSSA
jgi:hypothetical protein